MNYTTNAHVTSFVVAVVHTPPLEETSPHEVNDWVMESFCDEGSGLQVAFVTREADHKPDPRKVHWCTVRNITKITAENAAREHEIATYFAWLKRHAK